jgi:myo-inositol catabolism protein IolH
MRVALDPAMLATTPVSDLFAAARDAGYDAVELSNRPDFIPAFGDVVASTAGLTAARSAAFDAGVEIASVAIIQAWSDPDEALRRQAVANWNYGITAAMKLGATRLNSELSGNPNTPSACRGAFLRSVEGLLPRLDAEDLVLSIEPHPWDFLETTTEALALIDEVGSPRLRYLHCIPHTFYLGGTATEQIESARGRFDHIHIADSFRPQRTIVNPPGLDHRNHQHFDIGDGEIDWPEIRAALNAVGLDGLATVQVFGWQERARDSFRRNRERVVNLFTGGPDVLR